MGRRSRSKRGTPYSKGDIREQYCINNKEVQVLESGSPSALFGCLSKHSESSCSSRHSFLSVCVGRAPSDENLQDLCRQPLPRRPVDDLERAYMRRRPKSICAVDPSRYAWIPEDEESLKPEHGRPIRPDLEPIGMRKGHTMSFSSEHLATSCPAHYLPPPPPPPAGATRTKHVSFARSHTLTAFDDAMIELRRTSPGIFKSQERLILSTQPPRKAPPILHTPQEMRVIKKAAMKAQATQTGFIGREPPTYLSLSPRTVHRVKMVSQGAQTNGQLWNGRRLMKSYSEAGYNFVINAEATEKNKEHDALTRTQSEEPRSPYMKQMMKPQWPEPGKGDEGGKKVHSGRPYKEIFIDFEPVECEKRSRQSYAHSDGDFTSEQSMDVDVADEPVVDRVDGVKVSLSSYSTVDEDEVPDDDLPQEKRNVFPPTQDSVDEEFHENLVYGGLFKKYSTSDQSLNIVSKTSDRREIRENRSMSAFQDRAVDKDAKLDISRPTSPDHRDSLPMTTLTVSLWPSPFASSDSLTNDQKGDNSDGIWNESQSTVLQAESDNGELSARTPSKKQLLLLQHQQRSSMDTEVLEEDVLRSQSPLYSPLKQESAVPFVTIATVHHHETPSTLASTGVVQPERKSLGATSFSASSLSPMMRETRRKLSKSPEKDELRVATDISETSTTEGDYATAYDNSGTDTSSRRSARHHQQSSKPGSKEGSSFDSASSAHSFVKEDAIQAVPSSPPPIVEENTNDFAESENVSKAISVEAAGLLEKVPSEDKEDMSGSSESSSSGSYSVDSGQQKAEWTDQERRRIRKSFKLDLSDQSNEPETWSEGEIVAEKVEDSSVSQRSAPQIKAKYTTVPIRRATQSQPKKWTLKGNGEITSKMVRSPAMPEGFRSEEWSPLQRSTPTHTPDEIHVPKNGAEISSDESSCEFKNTGIEETINGHSPRRQRRRGGGRERRNHVGENGPRRRPLAPIPANQQQLSPSATKYGRSPGHSPRSSPRKAMKGTKPQEHRKNLDSPEVSGHLKALSAESLRSVSPGSDSVFYNEGEAHVVCHHCGREVEGDANAPVEEDDKEIVQPPAGFADSPENARAKTHRYYKKQEKRFRSEERGERRRHSRFRTEGLRAKSEERGKEKGSKMKLRPHARSIDASMERLRGADSSPSISEPLTAEEPRVFAEAYRRSCWICIVEGDPPTRSIEADEERSAADSRFDSTSSEKEFRRKYQAAIHRMVHRKSSMEMYRRLQTKSFVGPAMATMVHTGADKSLREQLEDLLRLMLMVWCTQTKAMNVLEGECDKKVVVRRKSGEFGFRIHGSRPVVVSAIEPDTPAESSGLEVGDIVLSVNGVSVLEASHSDVVKLAHAGSDTLELEIARTNNVLPVTGKESHAAQCSGFLYKRGDDGRWHQRWFALKSDNCIYCYKTQGANQPLGALMLYNYTFNAKPESGRAHSFALEKPGAKGLELAAKNEEAFQKWKTHLERATKADPAGSDHWFEKSRNLLYQPASAVPQPDCFGHLTQLEDKWRRRYCVLKDAALLLYTDSNASRALAIACLQGYRVQSSGVSGKRFSFEVIPPQSKQKHFYFYTDTEIDKKRWIAAIEYSIDRWMQVG